MGNPAVRPEGRSYRLVLADCLQWMDERPQASIEAIVTDHPTV
jgi:hypothetical protein